MTVTRNHEGTKKYLLLHYPGRHTSHVLYVRRLERIHERSAQGRRPRHERWFVDDEAFRAIGQPDAPNGGRKVALEADTGGQPSEKQPTRRQNTPHLLQHAREFPLVTCEVQNSAANDRVRRGVLPRKRIKRPAMNLAGLQCHVQFGHEPTHRADGAAVNVCDPYVETVCQEIGQIATATTSRVENAPPAVESASKKLIEKIDVNFPELASELGGHGAGHGR